jgi:hypothetical protein
VSGSDLKSQWFIKTPLEVFYLLSGSQIKDKTQHTQAAHVLVFV